ncbi:MAG: NAD(P)/FAD-dependent oxidoreductase, partial [Acidimicrobiia bacterium]|nr:NAD(P)/FAD-dependent oxidoreductase [Acidimicrobiia bacterium]
GWTLQRYFDQVKMPSRLQAVLAGQAGDYLLPPERVSLLLHVALVGGYDRGAYYPEKHFSHFIDSIVDSIRNTPGCEVLLEHEVKGFGWRGDRIASVETVDGKQFWARRFISNVDPRQTMRLLGRPVGTSRYRRRLSYAYSSSNFTLYLGVRDLDLRDYGFGSYNVWHYPHDDVNAIYRQQVVDRDLSNPWLFLSTPTLHSDAPGLAPPGHQVLEVATSCNYDYFAELARKDRRSYTRAKVAVRDRILTILEAEYVPGLRKHLAMRVAGTPLTNERFCRAPRGNAYGSVLSPEYVFPRVDTDTPVDNLYLVNATAGFPSIGGTVGAGMKLYRRLVGGGATS